MNERAYAKNFTTCGLWFFLYEVSMSLFSAFSLAGLAAREGNVVGIGQRCPRPSNAGPKQSLPDVQNVVAPGAMRDELHAAQLL